MDQNENAGAANVRAPGVAPPADNDGNPAVPAWARANIVTSGEEDDSSSSSQEELEGENAAVSENVVDGNDFLYYDPQSDLMDELYVQQQLRSSRGVARGNNQDTERNETSGGKQVSGGAEKHTDTAATATSSTSSFSSDATLHCPCCFQVVCLDCQKHARYEQYRAMFVCNIAVQWSHRVVYDEAAQGLVAAAAKETIVASATAERSSTATSRPDHNVVRSTSEDEGDQGTRADGHRPEKNEPTYYYKTVCGSCGTEVAALDMSDEVYHFYGCVASPPPTSSPAASSLLR